MIDYRPGYPDQEGEGQDRVNPQIGLALMRRVAEAHLDIAPTVGESAPAYVTDIVARLAPFNSAPYNPPPPATQQQVWTESEGQGVGGGIGFELYPLWPAEVVDGLVADAPTRRTAQASSRRQPFTVAWPWKPRPVLLFPAAVRAGVGGAGDFAWSAAEIVAGLNAYLHEFLGPNLLSYAPGGGTENAGVAQAVNDMLVQAPRGPRVLLAAARQRRLPRLRRMGHRRAGAVCGVDRGDGRLPLRVAQPVGTCRRGGVMRRSGRRVPRPPWAPTVGLGGWGGAVVGHEGRRVLQRVAQGLGGWVAIGGLALPFLLPPLSPLPSPR